MSELPRFWTPAFIERFVDAMNHDPDFQKTVADFSETIVFRCLDDPDGKDIAAAYTFDEGYVSAKIEQGDAPAPEIRDAPFDRDTMFARATAPYHVWVKLDKGEMTALGALSSPEYKIEGPKLKIMLNMHIFNAMSEISASIPKTY